MDVIIECGYFIQSYAKDVNFCVYLSRSHSRANVIYLGTRLLKNLPGNKVDVIAKFRERLKKLHDAFIDETIVNVDINVLRILGQVGSISERFEEHGMTYVIAIYM
jgi:hypothetical protein